MNSNPISDTGKGERPFLLQGTLATKFQVGYPTSHTSDGVVAPATIPGARSRLPPPRPMKDSWDPTAATSLVLQSKVAAESLS